MTPRSEAGPAEFSRDRAYRYTLRRVWDAARPEVAWIGLNPSTADEETLDPTLRRILRFSDDFGYGSFTMLNLFAFRATSPLSMKAKADPIGHDNDQHLSAICARARIVVCAWGTHGTFMERDRQVAKLLDIKPNNLFEPGSMGGGKFYCLGTSKEGHPKHPLYLSSETKLEPFRCR